MKFQKKIILIIIIFIALHESRNESLPEITNFADMSFISVAGESWNCVQLNKGEMT